uniref:SHSP domain-containing protein n=1 Tax=Kalanchoe fedtschenkoi TaxID=63787 RepID=A0A7N1A4Q3_KALFE
MSTVDEWNWKETPECHIFKFHLRGFSKTDVKIELQADSRVLCINATREMREEEEEMEGQIWHCRERPSDRSFSRQFRLPPNAEMDGITASMKDGVLVVSVPKEYNDVGDESKKMEKIKKRSVEIKAGKDNQQGRGKGGREGLRSCFVCFKKP